MSLVCCLVEVSASGFFTRPEESTEYDREASTVIRP